MKPRTGADDKRINVTVIGRTTTIGKAFVVLL